MIRFILGIFLLSEIGLASTKVAITFDDLPAHGEATESPAKIIERIVSTLRKHQVRDAVGFVNGGTLGDESKSKQVLKIWYDNGFLLGNHTFNHFDLNRVGLQKFENDVTKNEIFLQSLPTDLVKKYFRFPYLREGKNPLTYSQFQTFLMNKNYQNAYVTMDFNDWAWNPVYLRCLKTKTGEIPKLKNTFLSSAKRQLDRSLNLSRQIGHPELPQIVLLHVGQFDELMLNDLLILYENSGVQWISLQEALDGVSKILMQLGLDQMGPAQSEGEDLLEKISEKLQLDDPIGDESLTIRRLEALCLK